MAAARAAGKTVTEIAREEGISRQWASRTANSDEAQQLIARLVDQRAELLDGMFDRALAAVEECLAARKTIVVRSKDGEGYTEATVDAGPDHFAAMTGVKRLIELATAGRPAPKPAEKSDPKQQTITLEQFQQLLKQEKLIQ